jgi:cysteinyl-tRNA synthetase
MAKSTGNNILPREILTGENTKAKLSLQVARFFMLQALQKHS